MEEISCADSRSVALMCLSETRSLTAVPCALFSVPGFPIQRNRVALAYVQ